MSLKINKNKCSQCALKCSNGSKFANMISDKELKVDGVSMNTLLGLQKHSLQFGVCNISGNQCVPMFIKTLGGGDGVDLDGSEVITDAIKAYCAVGGVVSMIDLNND